MFDKAFRKIAVELSYVKGWIQEAARELGIVSVSPGYVGAGALVFL